MEDNSKNKRNAFQIVILIICCAFILINIGYLSRVMSVRRIIEHDFNTEFQVWVSSASCIDITKDITQRNLNRLLKRGEDIILMTMEAQPISEGSEAFQITLKGNDIRGFNCWDCDETVDEDNYQEHLAEGHKVMVRLSRSKTFKISTVRCDMVNGDYTNGVENTGSVPVFVRVEVTDAKDISYDESLWCRDGEYLYYKQPLFPGEATDSPVDGESVVVNEATVVNASLYAPDQILKAFRTNGL